MRTTESRHAISHRPHIQKQDLQPERAYQTLVARAYEYLRNSLRDVKEEMVEATA